MSPTAENLLQALTKLAPEIAEAAPDIERDRAVPERLIARLADTGVFRLAAPRTVGGLQADPTTMLAACELLGRADGSTGWTAMIGAATSVVLGYLDPAVAARMLADPRCLVAGVAAPSGRATPAPGGFRVGGRWAFASASQQATWLVGGCLVLDGGTVALGPAGLPQVLLVVMPRAEVTVHDTWDAVGLCGTGSHDVQAEDVFVPAERTFSLAVPPSTPHGAFPVLSLLAMGIGAVALGIAQAAIDEFTRLAEVKLHPLTRQPLAAKPAAQAVLAEATALHAAGRAFLHDQVGRCWAQAGTGEAVPLAERARLRLAITNATTMAADAVGRLYRAAGGTAAYRSSPLQRQFRDVSTAAQHALVNADTLELVGAVLLGQDVSTLRL
ncbi:acyl-CoA dehydrogenase family protein [Catellatospora sp. KI3]|uniref:acyl-CoA dehydrogenase family protein n=1 Tax=Catellatospora sp. KI3 TaxID=3041620 RepID=UPI002482D83B|nr:acyl-CoA dehydrogenase family protein [Catellatospora sp. KI3]MDI1465174.1 acyl-CoA dehydrogenase family protein [Catellatospora sp. KI3]